MTRPPPARPPPLPLLAAHSHPDATSPAVHLPHPLDPWRSSLLQIRDVAISLFARSKGTRAASFRVRSALGYCAYVKPIAVVGVETHSNEFSIQNHWHEHSRIFRLFRFSAEKQIQRQSHTFWPGGCGKASCPSVGLFTSVTAERSSPSIRRWLEPRVYAHNATHTSDIHEEWQEVPYTIIQPTTPYIFRGRIIQTRLNVLRCTLGSVAVEGAQWYHMGCARPSQSGY